MTVCMICGRNDCPDHGQEFGYPEELIKAVFGESENYFEKIAQSAYIPINGAIEKAYRDKKFIINPDGFRFCADYCGRTYNVGFVDTRLFKFGVMSRLKKE